MPGIRAIRLPLEHLLVTNLRFCWTLRLMMPNSKVQHLLTGDVALSTKFRIMGFKLKSLLVALKRFRKLSLILVHIPEIREKDRLSRFQGNGFFDPLDSR